MSHWKIIHGAEDEFYFLTATIVDWTYVFTEPKFFHLIIKSLQYCQENKNLRIAGYVIMPNHLHLICAGSRTHPLSDTMRDFKQYTAKKIIEELTLDRRSKEIKIFQMAALEDGRGNDHKIWNEGNHPILLNSEYLFREKLIYMHNNPARKGYVEMPEHWLYSSARNYLLGDHSVLSVKCLI